MRTLLLLLTISLVVAGCSQEQPRHSTLAEAERVVDELPDSAVRLLAPFDTDSFTTAADRACYGLVFTEAIHRIGLTFASDSLISESEHYYRQSGDRERLARSLLHHAIVLYTQQAFADAFNAIKQAEELDAQLDEPALTYELYAVLGDMHDNAGDAPATLTCYRRSLAAAREAGNEQWEARTLNNLATKFDQLGCRDSFSHYMRMVKPMLPRLDGSIKATTLCNLGSYQLRQGERQKAKENLQKALQLAYIDKATLLLGDIAAQEGDTLRATSLWYQTLQALETDLKIKAYERLITHFNNKQNHLIASDLSQRLNRLYRENYELSDRSGITGMQRQYDRTRQERRHYRLVIGLLATVTLLMALLLALSYYHRWRMKRYNRLVNDISTQLNDMEQLQQKLRQQQQTDSQQQLQAADIVARLRTLAQRGQPATEADWTALLSAYRQHCPQFLGMLSAIGSLSAREMNVCLLIRLRFLPSEVASLTAASPQSVTNLRVRLLQKVFHRSGGARDFDEQIREV